MLLITLCVLARYHHFISVIRAHFVVFQVAKDKETRPPVDGEYIPAEQKPGGIKGLNLMVRVLNQLVWIYDRCEFAQSDKVMCKIVLHIQVL